MLILLLAVAIIYLIIGDRGEAYFMFLAIVAVSAISFYQDNRSKKALEALEKLNEPLSTAIRNSQVIKIPTHDLVVGDLCIVEEGKMINADGKIMYSHDFSVNESLLTGESLSVYKNSESKDNLVYDGTMAASGLAVFEVEQIGRQTRLGKIGNSIAAIKEDINPTIKTICNEAPLKTYKGNNRATKNTPATTIVAACIKALTGVGPSMASGNQT